MVNKKGGKGYKKNKKDGNKVPTFEIAESGQTYAKIIKKLGDRRFSIIIHNSREKSIGKARGSLKGWHNLKSDDIVLVSNRDFRKNDNDSFVQNVYDIIGIYLPEHIKKLRKMGEITDQTFTESKEEEVNEMVFDEKDMEDEEQIPPQKPLDFYLSDSEEEIDIDHI